MRKCELKKFKRKFKNMSLFSNTTFTKNIYKFNFFFWDKKCQWNLQTRFGFNLKHFSFIFWARRHRDRFRWVHPVEPPTFRFCSKSRRSGDGHWTGRRSGGRRQVRLMKSLSIRLKIRLTMSPFRSSVLTVLEC